MKEMEKGQERERESRAERKKQNDTRGTTKYNEDKFCTCKSTDGIYTHTQVATICNL